MKRMTTRDVQQVSLEILKDVHEFCVKNNIKYSLCGGTLIGAIRHNGFIPWDDDVDIVMPRPDYEKFIKSYKSQRGYKLFSPEVDGVKNVFIRITKICDINKTLMVKNLYQWTDEETGIGIDVIAAEGAPNTKEEANQHIEIIRKKAKLLDWYRISRAPWNVILRQRPFLKVIKCIIKKFIGRILGPKSLNNLINYQHQYDYSVSNYFIAGYTYGIGEWQSKAIFDDYVLHKFEDTEFYVTSLYDQYLKSLFGNYMELPPVDKRESHDFFDYYWKNN